jgi:hypothetical protein
MKSKIFAITVILFIFLPVTFVAIREIMARRAERKKVPHVKEAMKPFSCRVKVRDSSVSGYILIAPYELYKWRQGKIAIVDMEGRIHAEKNVTGTVYDFRQWNIDGKIYYTYLRNDSNTFHIRKISLTAGHAVLLDEMLNEVKHIHLLPHDDITTTGNKGLDLHDIILFTPDHYITIAAYEKGIGNIPDSLHPTPFVKVAAPIIQEVRHDSVIWQWDATRFPELYSCGDLYNNYRDEKITKDYLHINSCSLDPADSNLVVSFRSANMVVKVSRKDGSIIWKLGGRHSDFALNDNQKFLRQHHARLGVAGRKLLLIDNGDSVLRQTSRVLEFSLDEQKKKITSFKAWNIPEPYSQYMGSVSMAGNNYFIGGGTSEYVLLADPATGKKLFELETSHPSYRAYLVHDIYGLKNGNNYTSSSTR